jgi:hypothetical protein
VEGNIGLTCDIWYNEACQPYLAIMAHFWSNKTIKHALIGFQGILDKLSRNSVATAFYKIMEREQIVKKVCC